MRIDIRIETTTNRDGTIDCVVESFGLDMKYLFGR